MLEKATQRLASMFDMKQVDTAKEEELYVFSAVEHVPQAAGHVGAGVKSSAQVRSTNCMSVSAWREDTCMMPVHHATKLNCCLQHAPEVGSLAGAARMVLAKPVHEGVGHRDVPVSSAGECRVQCRCMLACCATSWQVHGFSLRTRQLGLLKCLQHCRKGFDTTIAFNGASFSSRSSDLMWGLLQKGAPAKEAAALVAEGLAQWSSPLLSSF